MLSGGWIVSEQMGQGPVHLTTLILAQCQTYGVSSTPYISLHSALTGSAFRSESKPTGTSGTASSSAQIAGLGLTAWCSAHIRKPTGAFSGWWVLLTHKLQESQQILWPHGCAGQGKERTLNWSYPPLDPRHISMFERCLSSLEPDSLASNP